MIKFSQINDNIALFLTTIVSSMWCAYAFAFLALISLPTAIHSGLGSIISWTAQTFLQLVLLSVIMVGQDIQSRKTEERAEQDHLTIMAEFDVLKDMHSELKQLLDK